jgi:hypothetical protein
MKMNKEIKDKNESFDYLNIRTWKEIQEERTMGKIIEDYGILKQWDFDEFNYHIFLTEYNNQYHIAIKKTNDLSIDDPSYTLFSMENAKKLRDFLGAAVIISNSKPLKPK